jgi:hypothetical protein
MRANEFVAEEPRTAAPKPEIVSVQDDGKTITIKVRGHDGAVRAISNSNPAVLQQQLNLKYGLRLPHSIARKFVGMPAAMAEDQADNPDSWESQAADAERDEETAKMAAQDAEAGGLAEGFWNYEQIKKEWEEERIKSSFVINLYTIDRLINDLISNNPPQRELYKMFIGDLGTLPVNVKTSLVDIIEDLALDVSHWPKYNTDIQRTKNLISKLKTIKAIISAKNPYTQENQLDEKSTSQAQFRTMAAAAHNPEFARKVGISPDVAKEFHGADKKSNYKSLPKKAAEDASWGMAPEGRGYKK